MNRELISIEEFRREVKEASSILTAHGFRRAPELDSEPPVETSVVYVGQNLALTFTLDLRDHVIDLIVTRYRNGRMLGTWDGGYSASLFDYLVDHCGFRGRSNPAPTLPPSASKAKRSISALINLLAQPCAAPLLADRADSLPQ